MRSGWAFQQQYTGALRKCSAYGTFTLDSIANENEHSEQFVARGFERSDTSVLAFVDDAPACLASILANDAAAFGIKESHGNSSTKTKRQSQRQIVSLQFRGDTGGDVGCETFVNLT